MKIVKGQYTKLGNIKKIAILADSGCREGWEKNTSPLFKKIWDQYRPELFIIAGDLSLNSDPAEYERFLTILKEYPSALAAIPGDHDRPVKNFIKYFGSPDKVIDVGKWRFIGVNTSHRKFTKNNLNWIEKNIRPNSIIFSHMPPEAKGWKFHSLWAHSSKKMMSVVEKHKDKIYAMFFGHIHGFSVRQYKGIPMMAVGSVAESNVIFNNGYSVEGFYSMILFNRETGDFTLLK